MSIPTDKFTIMRTIRERLGASLREAHDFYMRNPYDWETRLNAQLALKQPYYVSPEEKVRDLIQEHWRTGNSPLKLIEDIADVLAISRPTTR